jgi:parallel beta-helix repeat protein
MRRVRCVLLTLVGVPAFFAISAGQALADHVHCGDVITQDTRLDSDLVDCPGSGIVIGADGVTLDLGGHVVDGTRVGLGDDSGINNAAGHDGVTIKNGTVQEFQFGVLVEDAVGVTVSRLVVTDSISNGILLIRAQECVVEKNLGARNAGGSVNLVQSQHCLVEKNDAFETFSDRTSGILLFQSSHNTAQQNSAFGAFRAGVELGTADDNVVKKNSVSNNTLGVFVFDSNGNDLVKNSAVANFQSGLLVSSNSSGAIVESNSADQNGEDGIHIDSPGTLVAGNTANSNGDLGIQAVPGVTDGGGNKARGNGNPLQCVNVRCK